MVRGDVTTYAEAPEVEASPLYESAWAARQAGRLVFTCSVTVGETSGVRTSRYKHSQWSTGYLIEAIESQGWRLEHLDHVWVQTGFDDAGMGGGHARSQGKVNAQMLFRRTESGSGRNRPL
ncbi:hypothetical protein [uncultured Pseudokineococcus sp.]|uniref:hypothetical protein n=1 Tax=uncultured Pseudokineococcus sp. TaxID=1642928 RepID=UPI002617BDC7|nr:hypothetical protein [uncultured Pseudokineococcus sp.]